MALRQTGGEGERLPDVRFGCLGAFRVSAPSPVVADDPPYAGEVGRHGREVGTATRINPGALRLA
jgi:hypothetical protein